MGRMLGVLLLLVALGSALPAENQQMQNEEEKNVPDVPTGIPSTPEDISLLQEDFYPYILELHGFRQQKYSGAGAFAGRWNKRLPWAPCPPNMQRDELGICRLVWGSFLKKN